MNNRRVAVGPLPIWNFPGPVTVQVLVKANLADASRFVLGVHDSGGDSFILHQGTSYDGQWIWGLTVGGSYKSIESSVVPDTTKYTLITAVRDGAGLCTLWCDAAPQSTETLTGTILADGNMYFGVSWDGAGGDYDGDIADVAMWNCALSASEIAELYVNPFRGIGERRGRAELIGYVAAAADIAVLRRRIEAA